MNKTTIKSLSSCTRMDRVNTLKLRVLIALSCVLLVGATFGWLPDRIRTVNAAQAQDQKVSDNALSQIQSLIEAKLARTPEQQKIDSNLLAAIRLSHGQPVAAKALAVRADVKFDADGKVLVDINANVTQELLRQIEGDGGEIINSFEQYNTIRARLSLAQIESLASSADIKFINRAAQMRTQRAARNKLAITQSGYSQSFAQRANRVRAQLPQVLATLAPEQKRRSNRQFSPLVGAATSAGDVAHKAAAARSTFSVNGAGVKIGVLSDSYNNLGGAAANVASGDLPGPGNPNSFTTPVTVLQDGSGGSDEGRAMLQIVHDLAPGARLYFATADGGPANFANNIQGLRNNGCDVIIDDIFYPNESPFQDGIIAQAVNTVTAAGALYFSSAGNSGSFDHITSGVWEGDFHDSGSNFIFNGNNVGRLHIFGILTFNPVLSSGDFLSADLFWSDPLGQSANDYDLYILDSTGTFVVALSDNSQTGTQDPFEFVDPLNPFEQIAIVKFSGSTRALHLGTGRGILVERTSGQTSGHSCAVNAFNVAAVDVATAGGGPFTGVANPVENFSSDGLRRVFYNANGTAITPGNLLFATNGGTVRQKPDLAAADGVATTLPPGGLNPFFGTSAAAPHAGAIAGLLKSFRPTLTTTQVRSILTSTALDIETAGVDRDSGFGIVMALPALQAAAALGSGGNDTIGAYLSSNRTFYLRNTNTPGFADLTIPYGPTGGIPLGGDWDGSGTATLGVYDPANQTFYLRNSNTPGVADLTIRYGPAGAIPVVGDWDGNGTTTIGAYDPTTRTFYLRNSNTPGFADLTIQYGPAGATPVVGDWDGNGTTTIGVYDPSSRTFYLRNSNTIGFADLTIQYGPAGAKPVVGDFDGNGTVTIGVYDPTNQTFYLRNSNSIGFADITVRYGPAAATALAGNWDGL